MAKKPTKKKPTKYTATDGTLFLELKSVKGGYSVTSPFVPGLVTQAATLEAAFNLAHDAVAALKAPRKQPAQKKRKRAPRRSTR